MSANLTLSGSSVWVDREENAPHTKYLMAPVNCCMRHCRIQIVATIKKGAQYFELPFDFRIETHCRSLVSCLNYWYCVLYAPCQIYCANNSVDYANFCNPFFASFLHCDFILRTVFLIVTCILFLFFYIPQFQ